MLALLHAGEARLTTAYINRIATAVPPHDVHASFVDFARLLLGEHRQRGERFERMVQMAGIGHRYSCIDPRGGFYAFGRFPSTAERMRAFDACAPELAASAVEALDLGAERNRITHLLLTYTSMPDGGRCPCNDAEEGTDDRRQNYCD